MKKMLRKLMQDESGASLIEYVLIAAVISVATIVIMGTVNTQVNATWQRIVDALTP